MTFRVGQKVVCIDDRCWLRGGWWMFGIKFFDHGLLDHNLNHGEVYTVTKVDIQLDARGKEYGSIWVAEARHLKYPDIGFPQWQFRPAVERKTDISVFTAMLTPNKRKVRA